MTNFQKVVMLNEAFGRPTTNKEEQDFSILENQFSLVKEEYEELKHAIENKDWEEMKDAIGDCLVVIYGLGHVANIDCDRLMDNISSSNFSKFCTAAELHETVDYYNSIGCEVETKPTQLTNNAGEQLYAVVSAKEQTFVQDGKEKFVKKGKLLKNINWKTPDLNVER